MDEQFGTDILRDAAKHGYVTACPAEKSGQDEFDFEYGEDFDHHIETFRPTFCKVLVRYNPEGDAAMNRRQSERLKRLSDYLHSGGPTGSCSSCWCQRRRHSLSGPAAIRRNTTGGFGPS